RRWGGSFSSSFCRSSGGIFTKRSSSRLAWGRGGHTGARRGPAGAPFLPCAAAGDAPPPANPTAITMVSQLIRISLHRPGRRHRFFLRNASVEPRVEVWRNGAGLPPTEPFPHLALRFDEAAAIGTLFAVLLEFRSSTRVKRTGAVVHQDLRALFGQDRTNHFLPSHPMPCATTAPSMIRMPGTVTTS